jgi:hypothetical protein
MLRNVWVWVLGSLATLFIFFRSIAFFKLRLRGQQATSLFDAIEEKGKTFVIQEELSSNRLPSIYFALCYLEGFFFSFLVEERLLRAGFEGTDSVTMVTIFRWQAKRLKKFINSRPVRVDEVAIYILQPWDAEKVGELKVSTIPSLYLLKQQYYDIESDVKKVIRGESDKTGAILYGPPGNGKSFLVRYLSLKFKLPIYIVSLMPDLNNHSLIRMFSKVNSPSIVLFEDFDSHFDNRKCLLEEAKFTFDVILNVLDGVFSTSSGLIFFLTANDLGKVDIALKHRPSRFKFVKQIGFPGEEIRSRIFSSLKGEGIWKLEVVKETKGLNLDTLLFFRERLKEGYPLKSLLKEVKRELVK